MKASANRNETSTEIVPADGRLVWAGAWKDKRTKVSEARGRRELGKEPDPFPSRLAVGVVDPGPSSACGLVRDLAGQASVQPGNLGKGAPILLAQAVSLGGQALVADNAGEWQRHVDFAGGFQD